LRRWGRAGALPAGRPLATRSDAVALAAALRQRRNRRRNPKPGRRLTKAATQTGVSGAAKARAEVRRAADRPCRADAW